MPPEALQDPPEYGLPLDVFSYGGVILHVVNQEWPTPLHYVRIDPETDERFARSEVQRRQEHIDKMAETPSEASVERLRDYSDQISKRSLKQLVITCLADIPRRRPPISLVSETITSIITG